MKKKGLHSKSTLLWVVLSIIVMALLAVGSSAYSAEEVRLRYDFKETVIRIVLEASSNRFIRKADISSSYTLIRIEFPEDFSFTAPARVEGFEFNKKDNDIFLNVKDLKDLKVMRLGNPPRLVIDVSLRKKESVAPAPPPPVTKPAPPETARKKKPGMVLIDPGHGGADLGLYSPTYNEKNLTLRIAKALRRNLSRSGINTSITRSNDREVSLKKRIALQRKKRPDIFISLHVTSSNHILIHTGSPAPQSVEAGYLSRHSQDPYIEESRRIGSSVGSSIRDNLNIEVAYREYPLPLLTYCACKAIMIELPTPDFFSYTRKSIDELVNAVKEGLLNYEKE